MAALKGIIPARMPLQVCHVITRLIRGGAQLTLLNLVRASSARGVACEILAGPETGSEGSILEDVRACGVPVTIVDSLRRASDPLRDALALLALARHLAARRPAIVHTHTSKAGLLGALAARIAGTPRVVYTAQGHIFAREGAIPGVTDRPRLRGVFLAMRRAAEAMSDRVVALTDADLEEQVALGLAPRGKYVVIPNGVDPEPFRNLPSKKEARARLGLPAEKPLVVAVGRLSPEKGADILLDAMRALPEASAVLVGDGPMRAELERRAPPGTAFLGLREDVPACLAAADAYVLPSRYEAQGMAVVEAMMAGLPVVAARVGGVPSLLEDGRTGLLVPPGDPAAMAAAIRRALGDRAMGAAARARALERFTAEAMAARYLDLYAQLLP